MLYIFVSVGVCSRVCMVGTRDECEYSSSTIIYKNTITEPEACRLARQAGQWTSGICQSQQTPSHPSTGLQMCRHTCLFIWVLEIHRQGQCLHSSPTEPSSQPSREAFAGLRSRTGCDLNILFSLRRNLYMGSHYPQPLQFVILLPKSDSNTLGACSWAADRTGASSVRQAPPTSQNWVLLSMTIENEYTIFFLRETRW